MSEEIEGNHSGKSGIPSREISEKLKNERIGSGYITNVVQISPDNSIFEIWSKKSNRPRLVKVLHKDASAEASEQFQRELSLLSKLKNPYLIEYYGFGDWNGSNLIEYEKIGGSPVAEIIQSKGAYPWPIVCAIGVMLLEGLSFLHSLKGTLGGQSHKGILVRKITPETIFLTREGKVKIADFSAISPVNADFHSYLGGDISLLPYLAPETIKSSNFTISTDLYSIALVLYEMICGKPAFSATGSTFLVQRRLKNEYTPLLESKVVAPIRLRKIIDKMLAYTPEDRYQSAKNVASELLSLDERFERDRLHSDVVTYMESGEYNSYDEELVVKNNHTLLIVFIFLTLLIIGGALYLFLLVRNETFGSFLQPGLFADSLYPLLLFV